LQRLDELDHDNDSLRSQVAELEDSRDQLQQQMSLLTQDKEQLMQQMKDKQVTALLFNMLFAVCDVIVSNLSGLGYLTVRLLQVSEYSFEFLSNKCDLLHRIIGNLVPNLHSAKYTVVHKKVQFLQGVSIACCAEPCISYVCVVRPSVCHTLALSENDAS